MSEQQTRTPTLREQREYGPRIRVTFLLNGRETTYATVPTLLPDCTERAESWKRLLETRGLKDVKIIDPREQS